MQIIDYSDEKLRNAVLIFATKTKFVGMTKLMKLLYYLDFWHYQETGFPVTGQSYKVWKFGPVPVKVWAELKDKSANFGLSSVVRVVPASDDETAFKVLPCPGVQINERLFSRREKRIISRIVEVFANVQTKDIVAASHERKEPWFKTLRATGEWSTIDYKLALSDLTQEKLEEILEYQEIDKENRSVLEQA